MYRNTLLKVGNIAKIVAKNGSIPLDRNYLCVNVPKCSIKHMQLAVPPFLTPLSYFV